jgi:hypothetical protein
LVKFAPVRFASNRFAPDKFALVKFAPIRFASNRNAPDKFAKDLSQPLQSTPRGGRALHLDGVSTVADTPEVPDEVDAAVVGTELDADAVGDEVDAEAVGDDVDAVGLAVVWQYSPGLQGAIVAAGVGQYSPGLHGDVVAAEALAAGVSDAVSGVTRPFNIGLALAGELLAGAAPSLPPQPARTSAPTRSVTPAAALPERRVFAIAIRTAHPQSPAFQPDEKPVRRVGSCETYILRHGSQKVGSPPGRNH